MDDLLKSGVPFARSALKPYILFYHHRSKSTLLPLQFLYGPLPENSRYRQGTLSVGHSHFFRHLSDVIRLNDSFGDLYRLPELFPAWRYPQLALGYGEVAPIDL